MSLSVFNGANGNKMCRAACFLTLIGVVCIAVSTLCTRESFLLKKEVKEGNDLSLISNNSKHVNHVYDAKERGPEFYRYINDTRINDRYFYLMNATDSADLRFCKIPFGKLIWKPKSQYDDLLVDCAMKGQNVFLSDFIAPVGEKKKVTIMHEVTKTGSTSVRIQIFHRLLNSCSDSPEAKLHRPGYHFCRSIPEITKTCPDEESFIFGHFPDAGYAHLCFDYSPWGIEKDRQFIHTIAFREFYDWAKSALNQVIKNDLRKHPTLTLQELCGNLRSRFQPSKCMKGMGETNFAKYSKSTLRMVLRESPESHLVLLHHYKNTTFLQTNFREQIGLAALDMSKRRNTDHTNLTCADNVLESYHACFDPLF